MNLELVTGPTREEILELVTVERLKKDLRITYALEDEIVEDSIVEAYGFFDGREGWLRRSILNQSWILKLPGFLKPKLRADEETRPYKTWLPTRCIEIPLPPLREVIRIQYLSGGSYQTLDPSSYAVVTGTLFGQVIALNGVSWPTTDEHPEALQIEFASGYGTPAETIAKVPGIRSAIRLMAADRFRNREDTFTDPRSIEINREIKNGIERYAGRYRITNDYA